MEKQEYGQSAGVSEKDSLTHTQVAGSGDQDSTKSSCAPEAQRRSTRALSALRGGLRQAISRGGGPAVFWGGPGGAAGRMRPGRRVGVPLCGAGMENKKHDLMKHAILL